jgi:hypothetical protein
MWTSCPALSAPVTRGRLVDWGWTIAVQPCLEGCYAPAYLVAPWPAELDAYVGTQAVISLYGDMGCGSVEGCGVMVDHWQVGTCDIVPVAPATWGRVKIRYR